MNKKVYIVGIGMNAFETMTQKSINIVSNAQVLIGAQRMLKPFEHLKKPCFVSYFSDKISDFIFKCEYENIVVLMSGDCGFYSGSEKLLSLLSGIDVEVVCGISSPVYFCSKLKMKWSDIRFVSLHGKNENIIRNICMNKKTFFLLGGDITAEYICQKICEYNLNNVKVYIGENLAMENERILCGNAKDFINIKTDKLSVMIVENSDYERNIKSCISDEEFIRGKVPMTKSEVRGICVSKLEIQKDDICWDIGCGTGSVSVEMAIRCFDGTVYSVERKNEAIELTDKNRHKFGCDNIEIVSGDAQDTVDKLSVPDCVFVGGSGGKLNKIIETAYRKNPNVRIVVTAVSLETLSDSINIFNKFNIKTEITQVAVTRTNRVGNYTMFKAENPVFIIRGVYNE